MELFCYSLILGLIVLIFLQEKEVHTPIVDIKPMNSPKSSLILPEPISQAPSSPDWEKIKKNYQEVLPSFQGETVAEVYYVCTNDPHWPFEVEKYHSCDKGILLKFSNGKWLNWIWEEVGCHGTSEIRLSFTDERETLQDSFSTFEPAEKTHIWQQVKGVKLSDISCGFEKFFNGKEYLSKMTLQFDSFALTIRAIAEADLDHLQDVENLAFDPDWTIIHV